FEARKVIVDFFDANGLLESIRDYTHPVGHSYRSHVPIEPYLSDQWYVAVKTQIASMADLGFIGDTDVPVNSLAGLALKPLLDGQLKFTPERYAATYQTWLENLRDWPISRQLWWGHQIPVWSRPGSAPADTDTVLYREMDTDDGMVTFACVAANNTDAEQALTADGFTRDPDVLDTWFSSALWPFSTLGWPEKTPLLDKFYPGNVLSTAREIITLWVSRMVMMGQYCVGDIPFTEVFIHAMIQDGQGRKMSKSLGNGVDPLEVIDSHGTDAMRYTLVSMTTQTQDVRMPLAEMKLPDGRMINSSPKFDIGRSLANKLWNASRFVMGNLENTPSLDEVEITELADRWILSRLNATVRDITASLENYRFNEMSETFYHFLYDDFCDWYVEIAKVRVHAGETAPKAILAHCLDSILRLAHPMMPYITEEIWTHLNAMVPSRGPGNATADTLLITAPWPSCDQAAIAPATEAEFAIVIDAVRAMRNALSLNNVPPKTVVDLIVEMPAGNETAATIVANFQKLSALLKLGTITTSADRVAPPNGSASVTSSGVTFFLLDVVDTEAERERLTKLKATLTKGIAGSEGKLSNDKFVNGAPEAVVTAARERLAEMKAELDAINQSLDQLG
ncbi:MAG: class I tRNA ligase family protein, partial [Phycisphaerales bacterium]|nr:class I tRNA ligase family protein [Phycisphaerales bacterium]